MQLSELLGRPVRDSGGALVGAVVDVRIAVEGHAPPTLIGLLVNPRSRSSYLGYERSDAARPPLLAALLRWRHRDTFLAAWPDVEDVDDEVIRLRAEYVRYSPVLRSAAR